MAVEWRKIGKTKYKVSNTGGVRNLEGKIKKTRKHNGYVIVDLSTKGKGKTYSVHRLVAIAFIPNPDNKSTVNHINGIKDDNRVENLEWSTYQENLRHAHLNGLLSRKGVKNSKHKLTENQVKEIRKLIGKHTTRAVGNLYGVAGETIRQIWIKRSWTHI